jgi:hypothetical protein
MTTLADLGTGDQFLFVCQVTNADATGTSLALYGPDRTRAASATINSDGTMTGQLANTPDKIPINLVSGLSPVSVGDVLENSKSGETMVCRWTQIQPDGAVLWSDIANGRLVYRADDWAVIGHVDL